jgi:hypothetical protein
VVKEACATSETCQCAGTCTGYQSRRDCPPPIVLAQAAMQLALGEVPALAPVMVGKG